jgi:hypothetical protein
MMALRGRYPLGVVLVVALFQLGQAYGCALLSSRALDEFGRSWDNIVDDRPTMTLVYLLAAGAAISLVSAIGILARQHWARYSVLLFGGNALAVITQLPTGFLRQFIFGSIAFALGIPIVLASAVVALDVFSYFVAAAHVFRLR